MKVKLLSEWVFQSDAMNLGWAYVDEANGAVFV